MIKELMKGNKRDFTLFMIVGVFVGIGQSVDGSTLTNFLKERFEILVLQRSLLEIPRELPGFLVFIVIGALFFLGDIRIAAVANLLAAIGMFFLGIIPSNYILMVSVLFIYSMGQHVYIPLVNSIGMSFAKDGELGRKLGRLSSANTIALVCSSALLWWLFKYVKVSYMVSFTIGTAAFLIAAMLLFIINPGQTVKLKNRFIYRKEYNLFYWLSVLHGARKQIFITFAPWVLVDVFEQKVTTMTMLFFIISTAGIFLKPFVGFLIDKVGERIVLSWEATILILLCLGYVFADSLFSRNVAIIIVSACYVMDQSLNAVSMARVTYMKKIAVDDGDVSPTLSMGVSVDHVVSMFIPAVAGYVWHINGTNGYKYVFIGGAFIAIFNLVSARMIRIGRVSSPVAAD